MNRSLGKMEDRYSSEPPRKPEVELPLGHSLNWSRKKGMWYVFEEVTGNSTWLNDWYADTQAHITPSSQSKEEEKKKTAVKRRWSKSPIFHHHCSVRKGPGKRDAGSTTSSEVPEKRRKNDQRKSGGAEKVVKVKSSEPPVTFSFSPQNLPALSAQKGSKIIRGGLAQKDKLEEEDMDLDSESSAVITKHSVQEETEVPMEIDFVEEVRGLRKEHHSHAWPKHISFLANADPRVRSQLDVMERGPPVVYVVLDTNVLLGDLKLVGDLQKFSSTHQVTVSVIPWVVLQELDVLKDRFRNRRAPSEVSQCRRVEQAVQCIFHEVSRHSKHFRTQSFQNDAIKVENLHLERNDDRLLKCALLLKTEVDATKDSVILCTQDRHLISKAKAGHIQAETPAELRRALGVLEGIHRARHSTHTQAPSSAGPEGTLFSPPKRDFAEECHSVATHIREAQDQKGENGREKKEGESLDSLLGVIQCALEGVLEQEMEKAFKKIWKDILFEKPPYTLLKVLRCYEKHWIAVFRYVWKDGEAKKLFVDATALAKGLGKFSEMQDNEMKKELLNKLMKALAPLRERDKVGPVLKYLTEKIQS